MPAILVIEDEKDLLEDMPLLLKSYGYDATGTADFAMAVRYVAAGQFDCVIMDLKMPPAPDMTDEETAAGRHTGLVVCDRLRKANATIPILVLTSICDSQTQSLALKAGASTVLQKPCYIDVIVQKVKSLLAAPRE